MTFQEGDEAAEGEGHAARGERESGGSGEQN